ncbi:unnamed protein product [Rotaria sp. Silwood2]|nr:unnamed protein product [Rotaria sp. Silwood2]CAF2864480.1 unnamed protein product [Rotaria sp. Silwood2]CAF3288722.1 unnamed protein product [Rotaria sp. Silwood2]CAF4542855.1 unnamed protein product [Rotaria sp. Silwood2]CAF4665632.1 unnamed protein product [Rotaria sp. Silwood2]
MEEIKVVLEKRDAMELFNGLGQAVGGRVDMCCAVAFKHIGSKKHSSVAALREVYGIQPTRIPGTTNIGGG